MRLLSALDATQLEIAENDYITPVDWEVHRRQNKVAIQWEPPMQIRPDILRRLRLERGMSQEELARRSKGVNKQTIHRLEAGVHREARSNTVRRLAEALRVSAAVLAGEEEAPHATPQQPVWDDRSEVSLKIENAARNALNLAVARYKVPAVRILELAPFLFVWAAEASLRRRAGRLDALEEQLTQLRDQGPEFPHLSAVMTHHWRAEDIAAEERESIDRRDLFGSTIPFDDGSILNSDMDELADNPFARFLHDMAAEIGENFEGFDGRSRPQYEVCREEAEAMVGGDPNAANAILTGTARLHEMTRSVREGSPQARAAWAIAVQQARLEEWERALPGLSETLDEVLSRTQGDDQ